MAGHICPWYMAYTFDQPWRKLFQRPEKILGPYLEDGMTVLDLGCGMGFFSIAMARMIGPRGKVISVDLQRRMLEVLKARADRRGMAGRIITRLSEPGCIGVDEKVDFALAFYMVHEVPEKDIFFSQIAGCLKPGGRFLLVEPWMHVSRAGFEKTVGIAAGSGLKQIGEPRVSFSYARLFTAG